ncbi:MAG: DUF5017 domain-containing protein [Bacteroidota bacterium]
MKNFILIIMVLFLFSCEEEIVVPDIDFAASSTTINAGESVVFTIDGQADGISLYTGDAGHDFNRSVYVLTQGLTDEELHRETTYLTEEGFNDMVAAGLFEQSFLDSLLVPPATSILATDVLEAFRAVIGVEYYALSTAQNILHGDIFGDKFNVDGVGLFMPYFTVEAADFAPEGGFDKGFSINPFLADKTYMHVYATSGTYEATLVYTNISDKQYSGDGYQTNRVPSGSEYEYDTQTKSITITVN